MSSPVHEQLSMRSDATIRRRLILALSILVVVFTLTWVVNLPWFDEALHPDLESLAVPRPVAMDDNAFPLIYALAAASDKDFEVAGREIVQQIRKQYAQGRAATLTEEQIDNLLDWKGHDDQWRSDLTSLPCNSRLAVDCADRLIAEIQEIDFQSPRLRVLMDRFDAVLRASSFREIEESDASTPLPSYGLLMQLSRLRLARSFTQDSTSEFLGKVSQDMAFWRTMLSGGQTLIAKMVALAGFRNSLEYVSALVRFRDLSEGELQSVEMLIAPLNERELDIGSAFLAELRTAILSDNLLFALAGNRSWAYQLFLQETATLNEYYLGTVVPLRSRASLSAKEFFDERGYESIRYGVRVFPPPFYNLGGKLALSQASSKKFPQDYISRMHDVNGRVALVLLQIEIKDNPDPGVESVVQNSEQRNPYTGQPMEFDKSTNTIGFACLTQNPGDVCRVRIGSAGD